MNLEKYRRLVVKKLLGLICGILVTVLLAGCRNPQSVLKLEGRGSKWTYAAAYAPTWQAALNACHVGEVQVTTQNRSNGLIQAMTTLRAESWGEFVAVWVRPVTPQSTEVEVVSRPAGPSGLIKYSWEQPIHRSIAAELNLPGPPESAAPALNSPRNSH